MQEGLVANLLSAVGRQWPSRGETSPKGSRDPRGPSPTAVPAPNWGCWIHPPNAAPHKKDLTCFHIWLRSGNNLGILCAINSNKRPSEDQLNAISPAYGFINELSPVPFLAVPKGWCASQECSGQRQPSPWRAWSHPGNSQCPGLLVAENPYSPWHGHCWAVPCMAHLGCILENTQVSPHVCTGWISAFSLSMGFPLPMQQVLAGYAPSRKVMLKPLAKSWGQTF